MVADSAQSEIRLSNRLGLSVAEAAASLGVSERHLRAELSNIPHVHIGNRVVIPVSLLDEWLRKQVGKEQTVVGKAVDEILEEIQNSRN